MFWSDQNQVFNDEEERPVLSRTQALNKFAQYILSFRIVDSTSRVISYGCALTRRSCQTPQSEVLRVACSNPS